MVGAAEPKTRSTEPAAGASAADRPLGQRLQLYVDFQQRAGIGWSGSPAFSREVSPYRVVDLPLRLAMVWRF